jgi:Skp family chaperone for outer membrane proteins
VTDLNELFKVIAEGKKQYEDTDPVGQQIKQAKEHVKEDLSSLFAQLSTLKEDLEKELVEEEAKLELLLQKKDKAQRS